jgi:hypothetical protein
VCRTLWACRQAGLVLCTFCVCVACWGTAFCFHPAAIATTVLLAHSAFHAHECADQHTPLAAWCLVRQCWCNAVHPSSSMPCVTASIGRRSGWCSCGPPAHDVLVAGAQDAKHCCSWAGLSVCTAHSGTVSCRGRQYLIDPASIGRVPWYATNVFVCMCLLASRLLSCSALFAVDCIMVQSYCRYPPIVPPLAPRRPPPSLIVGNTIVELQVD